MISIKSVGTRLLAGLAVGAAAGATLLVPSAAHAAPASQTAATAVTATTPSGGLLRPGQYLKPGQYLRSLNKVYTLVMQTDGNAVLVKGRTPIWATMTNRKSSTLMMRPDGNLVVISGRTTVWASGTAGSTGAILNVQNDSNLVLYNIRRKAVWSRYMVMVNLYPGRVLSNPVALYSQNRVYRAQMQADGNLVIVKYGKTPIWSTKTVSKGAFATMQTDGNFVVYSAAKKPLWASKTTRKGSVLQMRGDGKLAIIFGRTTVWVS
ncbi:hypothetical protein ACFV9C_04935 [Kribbella sp. NPDC059898]|uniref:hypothetical protein n=1 Tax=Kribbella sp. NPDC059898 TaxID=3346995 RepID=UPI003660BCD6